jgi:hypothetical protein
MTGDLVNYNFSCPITFILFRRSPSVEGPVCPRQLPRRRDDAAGSETVHLFPHLYNALPGSPVRLALNLLLLSLLLPPHLLLEPLPAPVPRAAGPIRRLASARSRRLVDRYWDGGR